MAQSVTLLALRTEIRSRGEIRSVYVTDADLLVWINGSIRDLHDRILAVNQSYLAVQRCSGQISGTGEKFTFATPTVTMTDAGAAWTSEDVGKEITIAGSTSAANDGTFTITARTATTCSWSNTAGVAETVAMTWSMGNITITAGTDNYTLPVDFALMNRLEVKYATNDWRPLFPASLQTRSDRDRTGVEKTETEYAIYGSKIYLMPNPTWSGSMRMWYVPIPTALSADTDSHDFVYGWDEYVVLDCLCKFANKEESDDTPFMRQKQDILERILSRCRTRDSSGPTRVRNLSREKRLARFPWRDVT